MPQQTILVNISYHGYGHLAQAAPIIASLCARYPDLRVVLQCNAPTPILQAFLPACHSVLPNPYDIGLVMQDAFGVQVDPTWQAYRAFHQHWAKLLAAQDQVLRQWQPTVVLSNIGYLPLLAAQQRDIPCVALCSLHWGDILKGYQTGQMDPTEQAQIIQHIDQCYRQADVFLQPTPSMPMPTLDKRRIIGPIARLGAVRPLKAKLGLQTSDRLLLLNLGGVQTPLLLARWPVLKSTYWIDAHTRSTASQRADVFSLQQIAWPYADVLCNCDGIVTKPGYGNFCDAACHGLRVLYARKPDWPESAPLQDWLHHVAVAQAIEVAELYQGHLGDALDAVFHAPSKPRQQPTGIADAVACLSGYLS